MNSGSEEYDTIWNNLTELCEIAFGKEHGRLSGAPNMSIVYMDCLKELIRNKKYWENQDLLTKTSNCISCWSKNNKN
jgi:hypothetical protein